MNPLKRKALMQPAPLVVLKVTWCRLIPLSSTRRPKRRKFLGQIKLVMKHTTHTTQSHCRLRSHKLTSLRRHRRMPRYHQNRKVARQLSPRMLTSVIRAHAFHTGAAHHRACFFTARRKRVQRLCHRSRHFALDLRPLRQMRRAPACSPYLPCLDLRACLLRQPA